MIVTRRKEYLSGRYENTFEGCRSRVLYLPPDYIGQKELGDELHVLADSSRARAGIATICARLAAATALCRLQANRRISGLDPGFPRTASLKIKRNLLAEQIGSQMERATSVWSCERQYLADRESAPAAGAAASGWNPHSIGFVPRASESMLSGPTIPVTPPRLRARLTLVGTPLYCGWRDGTSYEPVTAFFRMLKS